MEFIKLYLIATVCFLVLDSIWLGVVAPKFYKKNIGHVMATKPNFSAAAIFYALFIAGLVYFVVHPIFKTGVINQAFLSGALFGLVTYGTYDLTSQAVIKKWPWKVTIIDLMWGTFVTALVSAAAFWIARAIL